MKLAGTGHRPNKLFTTAHGNCYSEENWRKLRVFAGYALEHVKRTYGPIEQVISGMALGWDLALAAAACADPIIEVIAAIPCKGQESQWPPLAQDRYFDILQKCDRQIYVTQGTYNDDRSCMDKRNKWMVQHADKMLALWDGSSGGTGNCINDAVRNGVMIINVWDQWIQFRK